jgi:hypothetical protein
VNAEMFVQIAGLDPAPDAYSGRGATTADLSGATLELIHQQIGAKIGPDAAAQFVRMIEELPYLSTEAFLMMFYTLEVAGWKWEKSLLQQHAEFSSAPGNLSSSSAGQPARNETEYIRTQFVDRVSKTTSTPKYDLYSW